MLKRIDHIGIIVKDIEEAATLFSDYFGFGKIDSSLRTDSEGGFKSVQATVGQVTIELIEPLNPNGSLANFLQKRGEGLHHISIEVDDIDRELELLRTKGVRLINEEAQTVGDSKVAFVHPVATKGILVELTQRVAR